MPMNAGLRRFTLTTHVVSSVGWLGAVAAFFALSVIGLLSRNPDTVRSVYIALNLLGQAVIVPLSLAALVSGLIQALGTHWGLVRHYWVLIKFALTVAATALLMLHQFIAVAEAARMATNVLPGVPLKPGALGTQLLVDAGAAVLLLLVTTVLSIYKPWGRTSFGRQEAEDVAVQYPDADTPMGLRIFVGILGAIVLTILVIHIAGGGLHHH